MLLEKCCNQYGASLHNREGRGLATLLRDGWLGIGFLGLFGGMP